MAAKKVFVAYVTYDFEMFVVADSAKEAEEIASDNADEEMRNHFLSAQVSVREADPKRHANEDSIPYGDSGDEHIAAQIEAQREAEENARIEANQLKLPLGMVDGSREGGAR